MTMDQVKWKYQLADGSLAIRTIDHVAIRFAGATYSLPKPNRHPDVIRRMHFDRGIRLYGPHEAGFLDCLGNFLNRRDAYALAITNGQLNRLVGPGFYQGNELYSEDLW